MDAENMRDDRDETPPSASTSLLLRRSTDLVNYTCTLLRFGAIAVQLGMSIGTRKLGLLGSSGKHRSRK